MAWYKNNTEVMTNIKYDYFPPIQLNIKDRCNTDKF